jgi:hypothetical protein
MGKTGTWRNLMSWWPWSAAPEGTGQEGVTPPQRELHQRRLGCLLAEGIPNWSESPLSCDECGRKLLAGERARILRCGEELLLSCPLCEERLLAEGCFHVSPHAEQGTPPADGEQSRAA